jgi:hypothetical protein
VRSSRSSVAGVVHERRELCVAAPPSVAWECVADLGGPQGWYAADRLWRLRFSVDGLLGGPGRRPRPHRPLRVGDAVDGWVVSEVDVGRALSLTSQLRMPGTAVLRYEVVPDPASGTRCLLVQRLRWRPRGLAGRLLWAVELPAHVLVLRAMLGGAAAEAERRAAGSLAG